MGQSRTVQICNQRGLHARASAAFSRMALEYKSRISVERQGIVADASSIMDLLMLAASKGSEITISAEGEDAAEAVAALAGLVEDRFGEEV